jgi:hypothetical protein
MVTPMRAQYCLMGQALQSGEMGLHVFRPNATISVL